MSVDAAVLDAAVRRASAGLPPFPRKPVEPAVAPEPVVFSFRAPTRHVSVNVTSGRSKYTTAAVRKAWKEAALWAFVGAADELVVFRGCRVKLSVGFPVARPSTCDEDNHIGSPAFKGLQDALAGCGVVVPSDTCVWVTPSVGFWKGGPKGDLVRVRVEVSPPVDDPGLW